VRLSSSNNVFVLDLVKRRSLRRVDDGPWEGSSDMSEPVTISTNTTDEVAASAPGRRERRTAPRPGESAIERKLRLRREQEENENNKCHCHCNFPFTAALAACAADDDASPPASAAAANAPRQPSRTPI